MNQYGVSPRFIAGRTRGMTGGWIHTVYRNGAWANELEGDRVLSRHQSHADAENAGTAFARERRTVHVIHSEDGRVLRCTLHTLQVVAEG